MEKTKIFTHVQVIDGLSDQIRTDMLVVVVGGKIEYIGKYDSKLIANVKNAEIYELPGMTVMPGMMDAHVHLCMNGEPSYLQRITESATVLAIKAAQRAKKSLKMGFTTLRSCGEIGAVDVAVKKAIEDGDIVGPRIIASGKALTITGGHGDMFPSGVTFDGIGRVVDGADEARKAAREQLKIGADNIKLMATGGGTSPGPATASQLTIEEIKAAVEEAEKYGKITAAHAIGAEGIINALKAGVRTIEHGTFLDEEGIELFLQKKAYLVPTLAAFKTIKYGRDGGVPEHHIQKVEFYQTAHTKNLKKAIAAGVKIITGTDAGTPFNYHGDNAYELECLVDNGLSEMEAIKCATAIAAEALKLDDLGTLEEGKLADLVIIDGNPLDDITILQDQHKIKLVFKEGELVFKNSSNQ